ncbi:MAG: hypothetical protein M1823_006038 [Watsoniomyces obsoletus]|nr:MAG: hypothetical protein M1823_006038 [Watsoniomyces obsoletus]
MEGDMAWEPDEPPLFYDAQVVDYNTTAMPTYHVEAYMSSNMPKFGPYYTDEPGPHAQWTAQDQPRSLADRITAPPISRRRPSARFAAMGLDGTDERAMQNQEQYGSSEYERNGKRSEQNPLITQSAGKRLQLEDLKAMKAKVVASLSRARDRNSHTPTVDPTGDAKSGPATEVEAKVQDNNLEAQSTAERTAKDNDFHMHIDDLLAEEKAAVDADRRSSNGGQQGIEQGQDRAPIQISTSPTTERHNHGVTKTTPTSTVTASPQERRISGSGHNRESSGPSELGEIVEEQERRRTTAPKLVEKEKGESPRTRTNAGEPADQIKRTEGTPAKVVVERTEKLPKTVERTETPSKAMERTESIMSRSGDDKPRPKRDQLETPTKKAAEPLPRTKRDEPETPQQAVERTPRTEPRDRVDSSNKAYREAPRVESRTERKEHASYPDRYGTSSRAEYPAEEISRPKEVRVVSGHTPYRSDSHGSLVTPSRDIYTRRPSSELVKGYTPRGETVSHRVIEIDDDEEYRRPTAPSSSREYQETATRAPREYQETPTRASREYQDVNPRAFRDHQDVNARESREYQELTMRAPREYQEVTTRRYVEEPISKGVIHLSDVYWSDLEEWLEMTGYHDRNYRKQALHRQRELQVLEAKRALLTREAQIAQEERAYLARAQSIQPREVAVRLSRAPTEVRTVRASSVFEMPPPPIPAREEREVIRRIDRDVESPVIVRAKPGYPTTSGRNEESGDRTQYVERPVEYAEPSSLKRRHRTEDAEVERNVSDKYVRVDPHSRIHASTQGDSEGVEKPPKTARSVNEPGPPRTPARHDVSESRLAYDLARLTRDDETGPPRHKDSITVRGRAASSAASTQRDRDRDRARSASPAASRRGLPSSYRPDEDRAKGNKGDGPPRGPGGYSQDVYYSNRKLQGGNSSSNKGVSSQDSSWNEQQQQQQQQQHQQDYRSNDGSKGGGNNHDYENQTRSEGYGPHDHHQHSKNNHHNHPYQQSGRGRGAGRGRGRGGHHNNNHNPNNRMDKSGYYQSDQPSRTVQPKQQQQQLEGSRSLDLHRGG